MTADVSTSTLLLVACSHLPVDLVQCHERKQMHQTDAPAAVEGGYSALPLQAYPTKRAGAV